jgi:hypothetical protein
MLKDKLALHRAMAGEEPKGQLQYYEYVVLVHPEKNMLDRESTYVALEGKILQVNQQCAEAAIIAQLSDDLKKIAHRVEVGVRPF